MDLKVIDNKGKETGTVQFNEELLPKKGSPTVVHEVVTAYLANQRSGTQSALTRAEVSGGGVKPWKQKGTGRARSGSTRSPLWRHGGMIFAVKNRSYRQDLPKAKKQLAFRMAFGSLLKDNRLQIVEPIKVTEPKTKFVAQIYKKWQAPTDSIFVLDQKDPVFERAARNVQNVRLVNADSLNVYDCLKARRVFMTPAAFERLSARIGKGV